VACEDFYLEISLSAGSEMLVYGTASSLEVFLNSGVEFATRVADIFRIAVVAFYFVHYVPLHTGFAVVDGAVWFFALLRYIVEFWL